MKLFRKEFAAVEPVPLPEWQRVMPLYVAVWRMLDFHWSIPNPRNRWSSADVMHVHGTTEREIEQQATEEWHALHPEVRDALDVMDMHG